MGRGRREKSEFGTYLVQAIKDANMVQEEFYTAVGIKKPYFYDILTGSPPPLHSAAHSGRWCGGPAAAVRFKQRPKLVSYIRFNHHGVVLCCTL